MDNNVPEWAVKAAQEIHDSLFDMGGWEISFGMNENGTFEKESAAIIAKHAPELDARDATIRELKEKLEKAEQRAQWLNESQIEHGKEYWAWREKFNAAIMSFDAKYAGWHYIESACDVVKRAESAESELVALRQALQQALRQWRSYANEDLERTDAMEYIETAKDTEAQIYQRLAVLAGETRCSACGCDVIRNGKCASCEQLAGETRP